jgi:CPA1 family monovalent cation:H+ antiporter
MDHDLGLAISAFALVVGATAVAGLARRLRISAPVLLVIVGVVVSFIPGVPDYTVDPEILLLIVLPPLLYSAALESSLIGFRANLRPIGFLSVGLVLATTVVVGLVVHLVIPEIPLAAAFALGAIVAPPDAVAAAAVGRELGLPRRVLTILGGESLVNDATALTVYRVAVAAAVGGGISLLEGVGLFVLAAGGGVAIGLVLAPLVHRLRLRLTEPILENTLSLVTPFGAYLLAEVLDVSGVLAVVVVGLYLGHHQSETSYAARLQAAAVWRMLDFLLESVVFALIGLQLPAVLDALSGRSPLTLAWYAILVIAVVILIRIAWVFPFTYVPRWLSPRLRSRDPSPRWQVPAVISWAGMRGVVSLAAAFALPPDFPARDLILFLTMAVVLGTLVLHGFTLPWVIRKLGVTDDEHYRDILAKANAQHQAVNAAIERLDKFVDGAEPAPPDDVVERLRILAENRRNSAWERLGGGSGPDNRETPSEAFRRLRREMVTAERDVFLEMRDRGHLDDEVLRRMIYELDLEEAMLDWRQAPR